MDGVYWVLYFCGGGVVVGFVVGVFWEEGRLGVVVDCVYYVREGR